MGLGQGQVGGKEGGKICEGKNKFSILLFFFSFFPFFINKKNLSALLKSIFKLIFGRNSMPGHNTVPFFWCSSLSMCCEK